MSEDTIAALITARASLGDAPLLVADQKRLTYGEADRRSRALAAGLMAAGVGRGSRVGMLYGNGTDFVVAFLAITRIGAIALPFSTLSTGLELGGLFLGADIEYLLAAEQYRGRDFRVVVAEAIGAEPAGRLLLPRMPVLRRVWFGLGEVEGAGAGYEAAVAAAEGQVTPADVLALIHTSGSTSAPKGVILTQGPMLRSMAALNAVRPYSGEDRLFSNSPFFWVGGLAFSLLATIIAGARLICSSADPGGMLDLIEQERPNYTNGVASTMIALARHPSFAERDLSFMRRGNLFPILPADVRPADPELRYNLLGMTEAGSVCLYGDPDHDIAEEKRGSFGQLAPGFEARIVDPETGQDADAGEFWLRGPALMQGYYGRERHDTFTPDGWYRTGDMMTIDADRDFYFKGRNNDMIKTSGANVSPREVEAALSELTEGRLAIVVGIPDDERGQIVVAVMVGAEPVDVKALQTALSGKLSRYKVPRRIVTMPESALPVMSSGKINNKKLAEMVRDL
jgi:acyl-CoA synthetase (AMP-forming)/AMP-acid ligase II